MAATQGPMTPMHEIVSVTPEAASSWLKRKRPNRTITKWTVGRYASDMTAGAWDLNGETIKFDIEGYLLDGQHRLSAVIESGVTVRMFVIRGLPVDSGTTVDCGRVRTLGDRLGLAGYGQSGRPLGARAKVIIQIELGDVAPFTTVIPTLNETRGAIERHRVGLYWSLEALPGKGRFGNAQLAGVLAYCHATNPKAIEEFAVKVREGADLPQGSAALTLREFIVSGKAGSHTGGNRVATITAVLRAAMAHLQGEPLYRIRVSTGSVFTKAKAFFGRAHASSLAPASEPERA